MPTALTLVVFLIASDDATAGALARAAQDALGPQATIVVRAAAAPPSDEDAQATARTQRASACAVVSWQDAARLHARVHLQLEPSGPWTDRELVFEPADAAGEKGRALGFALASMLPPRAGAPPQVEPAPEPEAAAAPQAEPAAATPQPEPAAASAAQPLVAAQPPATAAATAPARAAAAQARAQPHAAQAQADAERPPAPAPAESPVQPRGRPLGSVDVLASATDGWGGEGPRFGGALAAQWHFVRHFGLRALLAVRAGQVEAIEASAMVLDVGAGITWHTEPDRRALPLGAGLRLEALALRQALTRGAAAGRPRESHDRWLPAAQLVAEGSWEFSQDAALVAGAGGRLALGKTSVLVGGHPRASLLPASLLFELGLRARF